MPAPPLLAHRQFRRLWLAQAVSMFGDWFTYVAVGTLSLSERSGLTAIAVVLVAYTLPRAVLAPLAGVVADRLDRRAILVAGSLLRGLIVLAMLAVADAPGALAALLFLRTALSAFTDPAAAAALPQLVPSSRLGPANALLGATWSTIFALGVAIGGLATAAVGPHGALAIDAATFLLAAAMFAFLPRLRPGDRAREREHPPPDEPVPAPLAPADARAREPPESPARADALAVPSPPREPDPSASPARADALAVPSPPREPDPPASPPRADALAVPANSHDAPAPSPRFAAAVRLAWRERPLLHAALGKLPVAFANGGAWVLLHTLAGQLRGELALTLGLLHGARATGTALGPLLWSRIGRLRSTAVGIHAATALTLAGCLAFTSVTAPALLVTTSVVWGLGMGAAWVTSTTRLQLLAPDAFLGRLAGVDLMAHTIGGCLGGLVAALIADAGLAPMPTGALVITAAAALWCALALRVRARP